MIAIGLFGGMLVILHLLNLASMTLAVLGGVLLVLTAYVEYRYRYYVISSLNNIASILIHALFSEKD